MIDSKRLLWFRAAGMALAIVLLSGCAYRAGLVDCPPACGVNVSLPANAQNPPGVGNKFVRANAGEQVQFQSPSPIVVIFPEDTPFVDGSGDPVYWFQVNGSATLDVRNDRSRACRNWLGCKYMVIDESNPNRPTLDPYIIIDR